MPSQPVRLYQGEGENQTDVLVHALISGENETDVLVHGLISGENETC